MIAFERPWMFLLLLLVPVIAIFYAAALRARRLAMAKLLGEEPAIGLARFAGRDRRAFEAAFATATFCLVVIALAGPRYGRDKERVHRSGADVVVVLDVSRSMLAQDIAPSRLERARREIRGLLDSAAGDRIALVTFAGDARLSCPLTLDHDTLGMFVEEADPNIAHRGGSNLAGALDVAASALDASSGAGKAVVVLSDGEDFGSAAVSAAERLVAKGAHVHAIGLGTASGAKIPTIDESGKSRFFVDPHGREVVTKLQPEELRAVAAAGKGEYLDASAVAFPMDELWRKRISGLARGDNGVEDLMTQKARFQWFLLPAILFAALWWMVPLGLLGSMRDRRVVLPARAAAAALALLALLLPLRAHAADGVDDGARGDALYRKGDFAGAAAAYEYAAKKAAAPNGPFNLGNAKFRAKKYDEAARAWAEAEKRSSDPATRRDASYNRGNALLARGAADEPTKVETLKSAIDAYSAALRLDPADQDARRNRAIAIAQWLDAQKQQDKKNGSGKDQKSSPDQQKNDSEQKQDGSGGEQKADDKNGKSGEQKPTPAASPASGGEDGKPDEKKKGEPAQTDKDGQQVNPQELDRLERMLDQRERVQRELEQRKARMHREPGENEW